MSRADKKLQESFRAWEKVCPEDVSQIDDVRRAQAATDRLERDLASLKLQFKRGNDEYEETTADDVDNMLARIKAYQKELKELDQDLAELKKWLGKVRTSSTPVPFALVVKGNNRGSLHVFKSENRVGREAKAGKMEITGSRIYEGTCIYTNGKLMFRFDDGARAPWKGLLQRMINQADVHMKVGLEGLAESEEEPAPS
jgi:hypothetical protein